MDTSSRKKLLLQIALSIGIVVVVGGATLGIMHLLSGDSTNDESAQNAAETPPTNNEAGPVVLDPQDQPLEPAVALIAEGDAALAKYDFATARKKYSEAKNLYVAADRTDRAADADGLVQSVDVEEKAYKAMKAANPDFDRATLEQTNGTR